MKNPFKQAVPAGVAAYQKRAPQWFRAAIKGPDPRCGLTRGHLYDLAGQGLIRTASMRQPGKPKGVRLFELGSVMDFIAAREVKAAK